MNIPRLPLGRWFEIVVEWLKEHGKPVFDGIRTGLDAVIETFEDVLLLPPSLVMIMLFALSAWRLAGRSVALFTLGGLLLIDSMRLWEPTMKTLALVLSSTLLALLIGIPLGVWAARRPLVEWLLRPILDFMQTMPHFLYLITAVFFFTLGKVTGALA